MFSNWAETLSYVMKLEEQGVVTRTFRRLDPERQQSVIDAILGEAAEKGPASINIKQVAARAGVSIGSLYQYFGSRENLIAFTTSLCTCVLTDSFEKFKPMLAAMPLRDGLEAYLTGGIEWSQTMMGLIQYFGRAAYQGDPLLQSEVVRPIAEKMLGVVIAMMEAARERGEINPQVDLAAAARVINVAMIALGDSQIYPFLNVYFQVSDENVSYDRTLNSFLELLIKGLS
ncbi:MAG: TetR/AcrR family transcriptional regulator [Anaerolineales bacterium]|nr:TetR/AcrR family transcriptional regulator [Anaerolineales bacterium]